MKCGQEGGAFFDAFDKDKIYITYRDYDHHHLRDRYGDRRISIRKLGRDDADQMLHLTATTGAMNLESYFESVEHSVETVAMLVQGSFEGMPFDDLEGQVENVRNLFGRIAYNTNGVLTYYFRIDPEISDSVKGLRSMRRSKRESRSRLQLSSVISTI